VAAELSRRSVAGSQIDAGNAPGARRQELPLNFAGGVEVAEQAMFVFARFLIEPAVFKSNGDIGAEGGEQAFVLDRKGAGFGALEFEYADQPIAQKQRHHQLGAHGNLLGASAAVADVARILGYIAYAQGAALAGRGAGDTGEERDAEARGYGVLVVHGEDS